MDTKQLLTDKQDSVLSFIKHFKRVNDLMPTYKEISMGMRFRSSNAAVDHVKTLVDKGYVKIRPGIARGIVLL